MLIYFTKEDDLYVGKCPCGNDIYTYTPSKYVRCVDCMSKNKELSNNKPFITDVEDRLHIIVNNICKKANYEQ